MTVTQTTFEQLPDRTFTVLMDLVSKIAGQGAKLDSIETGLRDIQTNTTAQLAALQERTGKTEAMNDVQNEKIKQLESDVLNMRAEALRKEAAHATEIASLRMDHQQEINRLTSQLDEAKQVRWMVRGALLVVAVGWPILFELVIKPMFVR